jgi:hypothetical protein
MRKKKGHTRKTGEDAPPDGRQAHRVKRDLSPRAPSHEASVAREESAKRPSVGILEDRIVEMIMKSEEGCFLDDLVLSCFKLLQMDLKASITLVAAVLSRPTTRGESFFLEVGEEERIFVSIRPTQSPPSEPGRPARGQSTPSRPGACGGRPHGQSPEEALAKELDRHAESLAVDLDFSSPDEDFLL